jgi:hypothetical protein
MRPEAPGGANSRALLERAFGLWSIESDPDLVDNLHLEFGSSVNLLLGDATQLPFDEAYFSTVLCCTAYAFRRPRTDSFPRWPRCCGRVSSWWPAAPKAAGAFA